MIKRTVESVYANYLPKGTHPFVYIRIQCDPKTVDVNIHPTKKEVHMLYEEDLCLALQTMIQDQLKSVNRSRNFKTQVRMF